MTWTTLIPLEEFAVAIDRCVVVDCRHDLVDPGSGPRAYAEGHIPGAFHLHQDTDLAGPKNGRNGRHPLPDPQALRSRLQALGLADDVQLVAYDAQGGQFAGRLWWLARWLGHDAVAVLDGGLQAWVQAGYPLQREAAAPRERGALTPRAPRVEPIGTEAIVADQAGPRRLLVIDARAAERYRGETEPFDPVAGHIPGALNRPHLENLRPDGRFKPGPVLRREFEALLGDRSSADAVLQCGSGVTACHHVLAMTHAGLPPGRLYGGSWSEWVSDPARPVAVGPSP